MEGIRSPEAAAFSTPFELHEGDLSDHDYEALKTLFARLYKVKWVTAEMPVSRYKERIDAHLFGYPSYVTFVVRAGDDETIAGIVRLHTLSPHTASLGDVIVGERYEHQGVAQQLVRAAIKKAKSQQVTHLYLKAASDRARGIYRHMGFRDIEAPAGGEYDMVLARE